MMCNCHGRCILAKIAWVLVIIGGLNWGLVGLGMLIGSDLNVVNMIIGTWPKLLAIVYLLVGIATIFSLIGCHCKECMGAKGSCMGCKVKNDAPMSSQTPGSGM